MSRCIILVAIVLESMLLNRLLSIVQLAWRISMLEALAHITSNTIWRNLHLLYAARLDFDIVEFITGGSEILICRVTITTRNVIQM